MDDQNSGQVAFSGGGKGSAGVAAAATAAAAAANQRDTKLKDLRDRMYGFEESAVDTLVGNRPAKGEFLKLRRDCETFELEHSQEGALTQSAVFQRLSLLFPVLAVPEPQKRAHEPLLESTQPSNLHKAAVAQEVRAFSAQFVHSDSLSTAKISVRCWVGAYANVCVSR